MKYPKLSAAPTKSLRLARLDGGMDVSALPTDVGDDQLTDADNVWWEAGALCTRPGFAIIKETTESSSEPYVYTNEVTQADGKETPLLLRKGTDNTVSPRYLDKNGVEHTITNAGNTQPIGSVPGSNAVMMTRANGDVLMLSSAGLYGPSTMFADRAWMNLDQDAYVPQVLINGKGVKTMTGEADHGGRLLESRNMLTPRFRASYATDGAASVFYLPYSQLDAAPVEAVVYTSGGFMISYRIEADAVVSEPDITNTEMCVNRYIGYVYFRNHSTKALVAPQGIVKPNNLVLYASKSSEMSGCLQKMQFGCWYGGDKSGIEGGTRFFVSGNPDFPSLVRWSSVNNVLYFPEENCAFIGRPDQPVTAFARQGSKLILFKEQSVYYGDYVSGSGSASKDLSLGWTEWDLPSSSAFPITQLSGGMGCDCPETIRLCGNRLVWLHSSGRVFSLTAIDKYSEGNVVEISRPIAPLLDNVSTACRLRASAFDCNGRYYLLCGSTMFVLDFAHGDFATLSGKSSQPAEGCKLVWYRWTLPCDPDTSHLLFNGEELMLLDSVPTSTGYLFRIWNTAEQDKVGSDGTAMDVPITFSWQTRRFGGDMPEKTKRVLSVQADINPAGQTQLKLMDGDELVATSSAANSTGQALSGSRMRFFSVRAEGTGSMHAHELLIRYQVCSA